VRERSAGVKVCLPLSSGYDSGTIASELLVSDLPFKAFTIAGAEDSKVVSERHALLREAVLISSDPEVTTQAESYLAANCEPYQYEIVRSGVVKANESLISDGGAVGLALIASQAAAEGFRVSLSGQGSDEIISDYGFGGQKYFKQSTFGGLFPDRLDRVFPWPSFFRSAQRSYLRKEEYVLGAYGLEGRYPFLDRRVVQEFLWLSAKLKNARYKAPVAEFLDRRCFPYVVDRKIRSASRVVQLNALDACDDRYGTGYLAPLYWCAVKPESRMGEPAPNPGYQVLGMSQQNRISRARTAPLELEIG
jgi:asparagine synthetase B (glutamine-hydrolysing)